MVRLLNFDPELGIQVADFLVDYLLQNQVARFRRQVLGQEVVVNDFVNKDFYLWYHLDFNMWHLLSNFKFDSFEEQIRRVLEVEAFFHVRQHVDRCEVPIIPRRIVRALLALEHLGMRQQALEQVVVVVYFPN